MLEIENETFLTLAEASKRIPRNPHLSTMSRWIDKGVRGEKLVATLIGGRRYVSETSLNEFFSALNEHRSAESHLGEIRQTKEMRVQNAYRALSRENVIDIGKKRHPSAAKPRVPSDTTPSL